MPAWVPYDNFIKGQNAGAACNLSSGGDSVKCALITTAKAPDKANDILFTTAGYTEVSGANYSASGLLVSSGQAVNLAADIVTWLTTTPFTWAQSASGFSNARYAVLWDTTNNRLIQYLDMGANVGNVAGSLTITGGDTALFTSFAQ